MKWKKKYQPALWTKIFGTKDAPKKAGPKTIRAMSNTMRLMLALYKMEKRKWWKIKANQICRRCGIRMNSRNRTLHHGHGRIGNLLLYKKWWIPLCFKCHQWVGDNPIEARKSGLLCKPGQWNVQPTKNNNEDNDQ